ncbi:MAG: endonuclease/exonuclease/phosphatase family protein [Bacteroidetes bacterium]|nr:endonuclease/exonuclease/phosphatase family protein [Bacteroidota bacterium]
MKKVLKRTLLGFTVLLGLLGIALAVIAFTHVLVYQFPPEEAALSFHARVQHPAPAAADSLRVMDWNIKFGGGRLDFFFDCYGDRDVMTEAEVTRHLQGIAALIDSLDPDILLVQEIDLESKRAAYIHQVQWLLDHTRLNHAVYASQWQVRWLPSHNLGRMNSGIAIFSKYPLQNAMRFRLTQMMEQSALTRFFYLRRCILQTEVVLPGRQPLTVLNTHLEAYDHDQTKKRQLDLLIARAQDLHREGKALLLGGDLNTLPPGARKKQGFDDSMCKEEFVADDYSQENDYLKPLYKMLAPVIPLSDYLADEGRYWGHSVNGKGWWNRTLDYLFTNQNWQAGSGQVHQQTYPLSDHAPLTGILLFRN